MDLDDILGETPESTPVTEGLEPEVETPEATEGPARDESGRFIPKGEDPAPAPEAAPPAAQEVEHSPPPGLIEERRKRQETEERERAKDRRIAELEQFVRSQQVQQPAQEPYFPSVYEDEHGFAQGLQQQAVLAARQQMMPEVQQQIQQVRIDITREMMASAHPDFFEKEALLTEMMQGNPALSQELWRQPNPVQWGYDYARKAAEVRQIGSLDIAAIKAAAIAEFQAQQQPVAPVTPQAIPTSLADQQSARLTGGTAPTGPPSLDQILGR